MSALKAMCKVLDPPLQGFLLEECVQYGPREPCMVNLHRVTNRVRLQHSIVIAELLEEDRSIARGKELLGFVLYFGLLDRCDLGSLDHGCLIVTKSFLHFSSNQYSLTARHLPLRVCKKVSRSSHHLASAVHEIGVKGASRGFVARP
jgi:hypothetical protein